MSCRFRGESEVDERIDETNSMPVSALSYGFARAASELKMRYSRYPVNLSENALMADDKIEAGSFNWWLPLCVGFVSFFISILIAVCQADTALLLYLFFGVILIVFSIALLVYTIVGKGRLRWRTMLSTLAIAWIVSALIFVNHSQIRTKARWLVWSHSYKDRVLAQQAPTNGDFRHVEWDSWGWGGEDTAVYLVFDPGDSLSTGSSTRQARKFAGVPCAVHEVSRLESQWYAVHFYTNEYWDRCK